MADYETASPVQSWYVLKITETDGYLEGDMFVRTLYLGHRTESFLNDFTGTWTDAEVYLQFSPSQSYTGTLSGRTISFPNFTTWTPMTFNKE